jgi:low temperature requirement protein LtrA
VAAVIGGPALFLFGTLVFKLAVFRRGSPTRLMGLVMLAAMVPVAGLVSPLTLSILTNLVLVLVGGGETWLIARRRT